MECFINNLAVWHNYTLVDAKNAIPKFDIATPKFDIKEGQKYVAQ